MGMSYYSDTIRYKAKSAKGKGTQDEVWRKPDTHFQESSPNGDVLLFSSNDLLTILRNVAYYGSSLETQCPRFSLGVGLVGTLCLAYTKLPDPQKESRCEV